MNLHSSITGIVKISLITALATLPSAHASQKQHEINDEACTEQKNTEKKLNEIYGKILSKYKEDKLFINRLKQSQNAWLSYREAHMKSIYPHEDYTEYGTVYPMCRCNISVEMTSNRIKELEQWTQGIDIGDVCTGSRSTRD